MPKSHYLPLIALLAFSVAALAQDPGKVEPKPKEEGKTQSKKEGKTEGKTKATTDAKQPLVSDPAPGNTNNNAERQLRLHMMDASIVSGRLSINSFYIDTEFGRLEVPVERVLSFTPGLDSHPKQRARIAMLIQQLGANVASQRDEAQKELASMGAAVKSLLEPHAGHKDPEVKKRVGELLEEIEQAAEDEEGAQEKRHQLINEDTIETPQFTVVGKISPQTFGVQTKYGPWTVSLGDIRRAEQETDVKPDIRRTVTVAGTDLVIIGWKSSGIRLSRGDKVEVEASGRIIMSPWGSEASTDPDGSANYGQYKPNMPGGALVARIGGASGPEFKVGKQHKFTAQKSGILHFAVAMQANMANRNYQFPGEYKVKVKVNPQ